jgi:hypothetical protein
MHLFRSPAASTAFQFPFRRQAPLLKPAIRPPTANILRTSSCCCLWSSHKLHSTPLRPPAQPTRALTPIPTDDSHQHIPLSPRAMLRSCWRRPIVQVVSKNPRRLPVVLVLFACHPRSRLLSRACSRRSWSWSKSWRSWSGKYLIWRDPTWKKVRSSAMCSRDGKDF